MKNTTLAFKSLQDLWSFKRYTTISNVVVNVANRSLTGEFSPSDIQIANFHFNAIEVKTTFVPLKASTMDDNKN